MKRYRFIQSFFSILCIAIALSGVTSLSYAASPKTPPVKEAKPPAQKQAPKSNKININTSSAEQIASALKGVGLKKAQAIVEWRKANGAFTSISQLLEVKGVGSKTLELNKEKLKI